MSFNKIIDKYYKKNNVNQLNEITTELFHYLILNELSINTILTIIETLLNKIKQGVNYEKFKDNLMKNIINKDVSYNKYINKLLE